MDFALSAMTLASIALLAGAIYLWRRRGQARQAWLMLAAALVMAANVAIWSLPVS